MEEQKLKTVSIKGKNYVQVNERVKAFRNEPVWKGFSIVTDVHELTDDVCVMCAKVINADGRVVSTGWAREVRNDAASIVNKTSYVENCETSAVGRALGFFGIGIDEQICSAQELLYALQTQGAEPAVPVEKKGGAIYPGKEPQNNTDADNYTRILADIDAAETLEQLKATMNSTITQKSPYIEALKRAARNKAKSNNWITE